MDRLRCTECGYESARWLGFCPQCRSRGTLGPSATAARQPVQLDAVGADEHPRLSSGIGELDDVLGGGIVSGSVVLLGGEPGVGKSTLLLQAGAALAGRSGDVIVASAEESGRQVAARAARLRITTAGLFVLAEPDLDRIIQVALETRPKVLVVDSIQTVAAGDTEGNAGGVSQVRECGSRLVRFAKDTGTAVIVVGHVTKDGAIAGPRVLEHMVDAVLYLEGEAMGSLRMLRVLKNRFGAAHQLGLFDMGERGLVPVPDASGALIATWSGSVAGTVLFPTGEGRRPLLVEVQALVAASSTPQPRRSVKGLEAARLAQVLAVLERHGGMSVANQDVYVSVVGGVRVREPAIDLPVALAVASSISGRAIGRIAAWGEVSLTGELRAVSQVRRRVAECDRLGLRQHASPDEYHGLPAALAGLGLAGNRPAQLAS